jgi:hypothetical protein
MRFDPTITLGSLLHAVIVCAFIFWMYGRVPKWAKSIEDKLDRFIEELHK